MALAEKFGPLETHAYVKGLDKFPEIVRIIKAEDEKNQWGENWHSDVSYNTKPTKAVIIKSIKIPPVGGDTCFSNMELAWETLDEKIKEKIKDKKAIHSSLGAEFFIDNYKKMKGNGKKNYDEYSNEHPIVRTHPETGKKILYVNEHFTRRIVEMSMDESDMLLSHLTKWVTRPEFTVRYNWTEGTIAMWDNRSTQHYVVNDFKDERIIQRVTIMGDVVEASSNPRWEPALREGFSAVTTHDKQLITHLKEKGKA